MKKYITVIVILVIIVLSGCSTEKVYDQKWYKGNLHTHSYWSDGDEFPEMIMDWYKSNGYDFVALSDHNILADSVKWKLIPRGFVYENAFDEYLEKYGTEWVDYTEDTGRISVKLKTYDEYKQLFEEHEKFLIIRAEEITDSYEKKPLHLNATNIQSLIKPQGGGSVSEVLQNNIDAVWSQRKEFGEPILIHINHPNFYYAISLQDMISLRGERFFEIYNGHPLVNNYGDSTHMGTEEMWDRINIAYIKKGQPLMYGIATDDSHNYHLFGDEYSNAGRGWVMIKADSLNPTSLINSMENGAFYASTGVMLENIYLKNNTLMIRVKSNEGINYKIQFIGAVSDSETIQIFKTVEGPTGEFVLSEGIMFVRVKIISDVLQTNPFQEGDYESAWTQPVIPDLQ